MNDDAEGSGPNPLRVHTLEDLARELGALRSRAASGSRSARVSLADLAVRVNEPRSTIHAYLTGKRLAPAEVLDRMVIALGASSAEQRQWADSWYRASASRDAAHRPATPAAAPSPAASAPLVSSAAPVVPHQLPHDAGRLIGRDRQLAELDEVIPNARAGAIVLISGTAGVGKTALAVHWARRTSRSFTDGQLYLDLRGFDPDEPVAPGAALRRLLRTLGVPGAELSEDSADAAAHFRSLMSERTVLLVLDNAADAEQVRPLLPGGDGCTVLITSRDAMTGLAARHDAHRIELDPLPPEPASELLRLLIGERLTAEDGARLAELCAGLPLALRIAAEAAVSRPGRPIGELVAELADRGQRLDLLGAGGDPRTALREVLSWSYVRLSPATGRAFRVAGLHPGASLTPDSLAALLGCAAPEARRLLGELSRAHLVRELEPHRYLMHDLLRAYAAELAAGHHDEVDHRPALRGRSDRLSPVPVHHGVPVRART